MLFVIGVTAESGFGGQRGFEAGAGYENVPVKIGPFFCTSRARQAKYSAAAVAQFAIPRFVCRFTNSFILARWDTEVADDANASFSLLAAGSSQFSAQLHGPSTGNAF